MPISGATGRGLLNKLGCAASNGAARARRALGKWAYAADIQVSFRETRYDVASDITVGATDP